MNAKLEHTEFISQCPAFHFSSWSDEVYKHLLSIYILPN